MPGHRIIAIGASAGGVEALLELIGSLPADLPAAVLLVLHSSRHKPSILPELLDRRGALPAAHAADGEPIRPGRIYVAPPDYHLTVNDGTLRLARTATEHHTRPAIDPMFRTAARAAGSRVIGVVLTGMHGDGAMGLLTIKRYGGMAVVQDPEDAVYPQMPQRAIQTAPVDHVLPLREIPAVLDRLAREPVEETSVPVSDDDVTTKDQIEHAAQLARDAQVRQIRGERLGTPAVYTCPDCGGTLWQADEKVGQFRCHVGHVFAGEDLLENQADAADGRLWEVLRSLVDQCTLANQLALKAEREGHPKSAGHFHQRADAAEQHAAVIRQLLEGPPLAPAVDQARTDAA